MVRLTRAVRSWCLDRIGTEPTSVAELDRHRRGAPVEGDAIGSGGRRHEVQRVVDDLVLGDHVAGGHGAGLRVALSDIVGEADRWQAVGGGAQLGCRAFNSDGSLAGVVGQCVGPADRTIVQDDPSLATVTKPTDS
jgi:hypothetical protein